MKGKYDGRKRVVIPSPNICCGEVVEGALEVGHGDALVDDEPLDLVEHRRVRRVVLVGAEDPARADHVDRRGPGQHGACLHRRGVGAQHQVVVGRVGPEGVLHGAGRVVGAEVEGVEVEPLGLEHRALGDLPAHGHEEVGDVVGHQRDRVARAARATAGRERDVDGLLDEHPLLGLGLERRRALGERLVHCAAGLADALARLLLAPAAAARRSHGWPARAASGRRRGRAGPA